MRDLSDIETAVELAIRDAEERTCYRVELTPSAVSSMLEKMGWMFVDRYSEDADEWVTDTYIDNYRDVILVVNWNGWLGITEISATNVKDMEC